MTPPESDLIGTTANGETSPAVLLRNDLSVLTRRSDFQRASRGKRVTMPGFVLQMLYRSPSDEAGIRIGYTCSKKVGNAVARNRAKRRLREIARAHLPAAGKSGCDYVLVGRNTVTAALPFARLLEDLENALGILHGTHK
jgi:ribonuclease P protein component